MDSIIFHKMHGLGNDFIVICDQFFSQEQLITLSDRKTGIGFDQALLIDTKTDKYPIVSVFNADGTRAKFCGNGFRCVIALLSNFQNKIKAIRTDSGLVYGFTNHKNLVTIRYPKSPSVKQLIIPELLDICKQIYHIDIGNEHIVCINKQDPSHQITLQQLHAICAKHIGRDINVFNVQQHDDVQASILCYERGTGYTQACGSGATATTAALYTYSNIQSNYNIIMPGGTVNMTIKSTKNEEIILWQTGNIEYVFTGSF